MTLTLTINTSVADIRLRRVVSTTDLSRLPIGSLVNGDTLDVEIYLIDAAGDYTADSGSADLAPLLALGRRGGTALAYTENFEAIAHGWSCTLALTTTELTTALNQNLGGFALAFSTTAAGHASSTWLSADCTLLPAVGQPPTGTPLAAPAYYTAAQVDDLFRPIADGYHESTNASGTTTISPAGACHTEVIAFSGLGATTRPIALDVIGRNAGDRILLLADLPATANITIEIRDASATGTLLASLVTDGSGDDYAGEYVFTGTAWRRARNNFPA